MELSTSENILGKHFDLSILSKSYMLYPDELQGIYQDQTLSNPNVNEYERMGKGIDGISYTEQTYKNVDFAFDYEYQEVLNLVKAIVTNQNPDWIEDDTIDKAEVVGRDIGLNETIDIFENQKNRAFTDYVKGISFLKCKNNKVESTIPLENSSTFAQTGKADSRFESGNPIYIEGWNAENTTSEQGTPDATALISKGGGWFRRAAGTYNPVKKYFAGGNTASFSVVTADSRIDAVVLYETSKNGRNDTVLLIVEGTEAASPIAPSDSDIETAVDAASTLSDSRWVRLANVTIDETSSPIVNTADIARYTMTTFTFNNTPLELPSEVAESTWFLPIWSNYLMFLKDNGKQKRVASGITSVSSTVLTYSAATSNIIEVGYLVAKGTMWNPLVG